MRVTEKVAIVIGVQMNEPMMLWGPPGQGKSKFIRGSMQQLGYAVEIMRVNNMLPHQINGNQVGDLERRATVQLPPEWAIELNKHEKSLLFLDDLTCAAPTMQTAALGLMDERRVAGLTLKAVPVAAANPGSLAAIRFDLDSATSNRAIHVRTSSDGKAFREDAMNGFPLPPIPEVRAGWEALVTRKMDLVTTFLSSVQGERLVNQEPERITMETVAWPSERTWEKFWRVLAVCDSLVPESLEGVDLVAVRKKLLVGCVGRGALEAFNTYFLDPLEADVEVALRHGKAYSFPERGDQMFALLSAVTRKLYRRRMTERSWKQAWSLFEGAWETSHRDRAITFALDLLSMGGVEFRPPEFYTKVVRPKLDTVI